MKPDLEIMRIESQGILAKNDSLRRMSERMHEVEMQAEKYDTEIQRVRGERHEVEEIWEKVQSLRDYLANEVERRAERLKRELDESTTLRRMIQEYRVSAKELEERLVRIPEGLKVAEQAEGRVREMQEFARIFDEKLEDIKNQERLIDHVDERTGVLTRSIAQMDDKIDKQLESRGDLERMEKRLEALQYFIEDSDLKIDKLQRRGEYVDRVEARLEQLHSLVDKIEERILDVTKERAGLEAQEKRAQQLIAQFNDANEEGKEHMVSVLEAHRAMEQVEGFLARLDEGLRNLQAEEGRFDGLRQKLREVGEEINQTRLIASQVQGHVDHLAQEDANISKIDKRLTSLDLQAKGLEASIEQLIRNKAEVATAQEELTALKLGVKEIHTNIRDLVSDRQTLKDIELQIDVLRDVFQVVEARGIEVGAQMDKVSNVETRVKDLGLLLEDVGAKYETLSREKEPSTGRIPPSPNSAPFSWKPRGA